MVVPVRDFSLGGEANTCGKSMSFDDARHIGMGAGGANNCPPSTGDVFSTNMQRIHGSSGACYNDINCYISGGGYYNQSGMGQTELVPPQAVTLFANPSSLAVSRALNSQSITHVSSLTEPHSTSTGPHSIPVTKDIPLAVLMKNTRCQSVSTTGIHKQLEFDFNTTLTSFIRTNARRRVNDGHARRGTNHNRHMCRRQRLETVFIWLDGLQSYRPPIIDSAFDVNDASDRI